MRKLFFILIFFLTYPYLYSQTPIDTIVSTHDLPGGNGIEVRGYAGGDSMTYRFYDNGKVVEK